jgi:hypothetical protein
MFGVRCSEFDVRLHSIMNSCLYLEISQSALRMLNGEDGLEVPLERQPGGRLTDACKERLVADLQSFLKRKSWQPRSRAYCAIGARGVSLRRITLPSAGKEEFQRLLLMQIESEFPLSPAELAWGYRSLGESRRNGAVGQELLVVAVKKEVVEEYSAVLSRCGLSPAFTLAALARNGACPQSTGSYAVLDVGGHASELIVFENGIPASLRVIPWGSENHGSAAQALGSLASSLNGSWTGKKLFVAGSEAGFKNVALSLAGRTASGLECEPLKLASGAGRSAAVLGLRKCVVEGDPNLLLLQSKEVKSRGVFQQPAPRKWAIVAAALLAAMLILPYTEAILLRPLLAKKLAAARADMGRLATIDRELGFLQFLKQNQPPYLDALYLFSKSAPSGARIESLTMNRRGDISVRGSMRNSEQVAEFRSKLIATGFFASVAVEEQTPTPDRQKVNVRFTAQWKALDQLQSLSFGPTAEEIEKAKNRKDSPGGGMPPGMPPGMMPPGAMPPGMPPGVIRSAGAMPPGVQVPPSTVLNVAPGNVEVKGSP